MNRVRITASLLFVAVLLSDRLTKLATARLPSGESFAFGKVFALTTHKNFGLIADVPIPQWMIIAVTLAVIVGICVIIRKFLNESKPTPIFALTLVLAGAIGNLWDRLAYDFVMDWILLFQTSVINIADIAIASGVLWLLLAERPRHAKILPPTDT